MSYYSVGCRKHVTFSINDNDVDVNQSYIVRVSNNTRPSVCDGTSFSQTACGFVIEFEDVITSKIMNPYGYEPGYGAIGGWKDCQIRSYINNDIYNAFPSDLKNAIIDTVAKSGRSYSDNYNYTTTDKLYLLNTREVFEDADGNSNRGINYYDKSYNYSRQLDYYESKGVTTKNYSAAKKNSSNWWLRSAYFNNSTDFYYVSNYGINYTSSNQDYSVSPAFRIFDGINN